MLVAEKLNSRFIVPYTKLKASSERNKTKVYLKSRNINIEIYISKLYSIQVISIVINLVLRNYFNIANNYTYIVSTNRGN